MGKNRESFEHYPEDSHIRSMIILCVKSSNEFFQKNRNLPDIFTTEDELKEFYFSFDRDEDFTKALALKYGIDLDNIENQDGAA